MEADTLDERVFEAHFARDEMLVQLSWLLAVYSVSMQRRETHLLDRDEWCKSLEFPMPTFRRGQQSLARRVYQSVKAKTDLLLEAPTGSGKSLAVLFPSLKAMSHGF